MIIISNSSGIVSCFLVVSQLERLGFILLGFPNPSMVNQHVGSVNRYHEFWVKEDVDFDQHWFLRETIWRSH
jgi:hypothetical protein